MSEALASTGGVALTSGIGGFFFGWAARKVFKFVMIFIAIGLGLQFTVVSWLDSEGYISVEQGATTPEELITNVQENSSDAATAGPGGGPAQFVTPESLPIAGVGALGFYLGWKRAK